MAASNPVDGTTAAPGSTSSISPDTSSSAQIYNICVMVELFVCAVAIVGNIITLACFVRSKKLRQQKYVIIGSLALADLLVGLDDVIFALRNNYDPSLMECVTYKNLYTEYYVRGFAFNVSILHVTVIGLDRFIAVMFPLRYPSLITKKVTVVVVFLIWLIPLLSVIPRMTRLLSIVESECSNSILKKPASLSSIINYMAVVLLLCGIYGKIWHVAYQQRKKIQDQQQVQCQQRDEPTRQISAKGNKIVILILGSYTGLFLPINIYLFISLYVNTLDNSMRSFYCFANEIAICNSSVNVFIYAFFTRDFKDALLKMFCLKRHLVDNS